MIIEIPYQPRPIFQKILHNSSKRWNVIIAHRRFGKTIGTINHLIRCALTVSESKYAYIAPTYKQAKGICWDYLKYYSRVVPGNKTNESELSVSFPNGSRITLYGADNPDSLRGIKLWGVVFDEYSQQPSNIFSEIIRPTLADTKGFAIWIGTPKGRNEFTRLYEENLKNDKWNCNLVTIEDSKRLDPGNYNDLYLESLEAKNQMNSDEWAQEWMCNFDASIKGAYYSEVLAEARRENRITTVLHDNSLEVHTWWDLGMDDYTAICFFQFYGNEIRLIDYLEAHRRGLPDWVAEINNKAKEEGYIYGSHNFPHDVEVQEMGTAKTRWITLEGLGLKNMKRTKNISKEDGINAGKLAFKRLWIDKDRCLPFLDAISQYRQEWDDKRGCFLPRPYHDWTTHAADAYRYMAVSYDEIIKGNSRPKVYKVNWANKKI